MVDKKIIENIILTASNNIINKCSKPSYSIINISNHIKHAMNQFARSTSNETIEHGIVIDGKGHVITKSLGDETSVYIPVSETASKILEKSCEDLLEEYSNEYNRLMNEGKEDDTIFLYDRYEDKIYDRINDLNLSFHVDHNHPGPYQNASLDYNVLTCLSPNDLNNCLLRASIQAPNGDNFVIDNIVKSKTAECSNGSRMTLVNLNPHDHSVSTSDFNKARDNLMKTWEDYAGITIKNDAVNYAHSLVDSGKYSEGDVKRDRNDLHTEIGRDVNEYIKKRSMELFPVLFNQNIKEFKELGFELRVDWL